tara:strand:- start:111 stop:905 length:795 start_codon:yes stop_codon:yes gene_type:complete
MIVHNFDPILIDFGIIEIRWYSLAYIFGILFGWWYGKRLIKKQLEKKLIDLYTLKYDDLVTYIIIGVIVGGRLGYVLFYNFNFYLENFFEIFKIWKGGMSFHGGFIGVALSILIFSKKNDLNYHIYFDNISAVAPIGLFLGRISNFINGELYGIQTQKPWGVVFPKIDNLIRHPSQIYEALLEGVFLFIILNLIILFRRNKPGLISAIFLVLYGFFRIICENFREPDGHIGYIFQDYSIGALLSFIMILFGILYSLRIINAKEN